MPAFNKILDTFLYKNGEIHLKEFHVDRVFETYKFLNSGVPREQIVHIYDSILKQLQPESGEKIVRVLFDPARPHKHTIEIKDLDVLNVPVSLVITENTSGVTPLSQFKFASRPQWETLMNSRPPGSDDVVLVTDGNLSETSRFNLFLYVPENKIVLTPPLKSGCLNGVFRRFVLQNGFINLPDGGAVNIIEKDITVEDVIGQQLYVGNSVRGLIPAKIL